METGQTQAGREPGRHRQEVAGAAQAGREPDRHRQDGSRHDRHRQERYGQEDPQTGGHG